MAKKKEIVPGNSPGALTTPNKPQRGFEGGVEKEDLIIPRVMLVQSTSPIMNDDECDVKPGQLVSSLSKEKLPEEFIPIFFFKNFVRFNPYDKKDPDFNKDFEPGAMIWRSNDPYDPKVIEQTKFGDNGELPVATSFLNFLSYFPGMDSPIIVSFSKTSYKAGKNLLSLSKLSGKDMFATKYRLTSQTQPNDAGGIYYVLKVSSAGPVDAETFKLCERLWEEYAPKAKDIRVHDEGVETEEPPF